MVTVYKTLDFDQAREASPTSSPQQEQPSAKAPELSPMSYLSRAEEQEYKNQMSGEKAIRSDLQGEKENDYVKLMLSSSIRGTKS